MDFSNLPTTQEAANDALAQYTKLYHQAFPAGIPTQKPNLTPWVTETMLKGSLTNLSNELILEIVKHLSSRDLRLVSQNNYPARNVLNLGRCSRRLYDLVLPTVYSSFHEDHNPSTTRNVAKFLCRTLEAPVGGYLKHLAIIASELDDGIFQFPFSDVVSWNTENPSRLKAAVDDAAQSSQDALDWYRAIEERKWDAWVALLLSRLPNLEVLEATLEGGYILDREEQPSLWKFIDNAVALQDQSSTSPLALPKLREVSLGQLMESYSVCFSDVIGFCRLRSVETLRASDILVQDQDLIDLEQKKLSTTDLSFDFSREGEQLFRQFLKPFSSLERLRYKGPPSDISQAKFDEFMQAIAPLKSNLLELDFATDKHYSPNEGIGKFSLGSLTEFVKLRSVSVMAWTLTGIALDPTTLLPFTNVMMRSLPHSLEYLNLYGVTAEEGPSIMTLIRSKNIHTPSLKELNLHWVIIKFPDDKPHPLPDILSRYPGFTKEEACELWDDCKAKGVRMVTTDRSPPRKFVNWRRNVPKVLPNGTHLGGCGKSSSIAKTFEYPYDGYEAFVREQTGGFDPDVESENKEYGTWN